MKKLIIVLAFFVCGKSFSQGVYTPVIQTQYGEHQKRLKLDSVLHIPRLNDTLRHTTDTSVQIRVINGQLKVLIGYWRGIALGEFINNQFGSTMSIQTGAKAWVDSLTATSLRATGNLRVGGDLFMTGNINAVGVGATSMSTNDLSVNGGLYYQGILAAPSADNYFLVYPTYVGGPVQFRTRAQVLSDIGAASATGSTAYIQNQTGSNLSAQTAKIWLSDTIRTTGVGFFATKLLAGSGGLTANIDGIIVGSAGTPGVDGGAINIRQGSTETITGPGYTSIYTRGDTALNIYFGGSTRSANFGYQDLTASRYYRYPNTSGTFALTSDTTATLSQVVRTYGAQTVSGVKTFTSELIASANAVFTKGAAKSLGTKIWVGSDGDSGIYYNSPATLSPNSITHTWAINNVAQMTLSDNYFAVKADLDLVTSGNGLFAQFVDVSYAGAAAGYTALFSNTSLAGSGMYIRSGSTIAKSSLFIQGYLNNDSIANFNPQGIYFYKPFNLGSQTLTAGAASFTTGTFSGAASFFGNEPIVTNATTSNYSLISHKYAGTTRSVSGYNSGNAYYGGETGTGLVLQSNGSPAITVTTGLAATFASSITATAATFTGQLNFSYTGTQHMIFNSTNISGGYIEFQKSGTVYGYVGYASSVLGSGTGLALISTGTNDMKIGTTGASSLLAYTNNTLALTINSSQRLLTTNDVYVGKIDGSGTDAGINIYAAGVTEQMFTYVSGTTTLQNYITTATGATVGSISYNGSNVAYNTTSDRRAKKILGDVDNSGELIDKMRTYLAVMNGSAIQRPMFIADELQLVASYAVTGKKNAIDSEGKPIYQQVDHSILIPLMITEIKSLRQRIKKLEK